jgi:deuterolysin
MKLSILTLIALAADYVWASAIHKNKRNTPLQINLSPIGNSKINVSVTNTDSQGYNLFHTASFLDGDAPVDKFSVHRAGKPSKLL